MSKIVDIVLEAAEHCLQFRMELKPDDFFEYLRRSRMPSADGITVLEAFKEIDALIPMMRFADGPNGIKNPNNGLPCHTYDVGREYSEVIYLKFVESYMPSGFDYDELIYRLQELGYKAEADETQIIKHNGSFEYRFWWD